MRFFQISFVCFALLIATGAQALTLSKHPALRAFAAEMVDQHGFTSKQMQHAFRCVRIQPKIIDAIERPKELLPWYEYSRIFLTEENVQRGVQFWNKHAAALTRAQQQYGVDPEIVVAIIGVETGFGRNQGNYRVLDSLTTLMLNYPPRAEFFRRQLTEYLLLTRELKIDPCGPKGSYAGAMGLPQFIPSSYRQYAVDFDGDSKRDLLTSPDDAIGSVAHYLKENGWEAGGPILDDARLEGTLYFWIEKLGPKPALTVRQLTRYGVFPRRSEDPEQRAALISLEGEYGPSYRLGFNNFYVITRYNHNKRYAMAVYELGEMIHRRLENHPS